MVTTTIDSIESLSDLRYFVYRTLCRDHDLMMNAFPTSETILKRGELQPCGMMFCLHGPRAVKFSAIWEKDSNRILFYGPTGKRYHQVELKNVPFSCDELTLGGNKPAML
ncbi:MAG: hypothetical protein LBC20_00620 [Planctomycetaceae bacterium]|jgi:hypothetical protein|nr:hypothetical protein [Planctomycetaceae bacterium]